MSQPALLPCPALPTLKPSLPEDCPIAPRPPSLPHLPYSRQMCCIFSSFKKRKEENENEKKHCRRDCPERKSNPGFITCLIISCQQWQLKAENRQPGARGFYATVFLVWAEA